MCSMCGQPVMSKCADGFYTAEVEGRQYTFGCENLVRAAVRGDKDMHVRAASDLWPMPKRLSKAGFGVKPSGLSQEEILMLEAAHGKATIWLNRVLARPEQADSAILAGPHGTGKTQLAAACANHARSAGLNVIFSEASVLVSRIRDSVYTYEDWSESHLMDALVQAELLVIDDLGKERETGMGQEIIWRVVNGRYDEERATLITTNLSGAEMDRDKLWRGVLDRLRHNGTIIKMDWASMRAKGEAA